MALQALAAVPGAVSELGESRACAPHTPCRLAVFEYTHNDLQEAGTYGQSLFDG